MKSVLLLIIVLPFVGLAYAENIHLIQQANIAELIMKKYQLRAENTDFTIFYRFTTGAGSDESSDEDIMAKITSIDLNKDRKSLVILVNSVNQTDLLALHFPKKLVSAEGKDLTLLIDGQKKGYESNTMGDKRTMIFILPAKSTQVEIVGTRVIPEFPSGMLTLVVVMSSILLASIFLKRAKKQQV